MLPEGSGFNLSPEILLGFQKVQIVDQFKPRHEGGEAQVIFKKLR